MRKRALWWVALATAAVLAGGSAPGASEPTPGVDYRWGIKIPLRDGVHLNATLYLPKEGGAQPVIFTLTPYLGDTYHDRGMYFAQHGYVFALVDVRGRGNSEGDFAPFEHEAKDGYDVVEWLARQSWCNGKVAMWGGSYAGFDQWATAKELPPHLATIVPVAAAHPGVDFPFTNGIFYPYVMQWITFTSGKAPNARIFGDTSFWAAKFRELYTAHRAFRELDAVVGNPSPTFQKWLAHPTRDSYWDAMSPTIDQFRKINLPILSITGQFDGDQRGALSYYREHLSAASKEERARHYLVVGPWDHAGTRTPRREVGGLTIADAGLLDLNKLHREWYDWTMKGGPKPEFLRQPIAYYVLGAETWKYAASWETVASEWRPFYLHSTGGGAQDAFASGSLAPDKPRAETPDHYIYDPLDTRPAEVEQEVLDLDSDVSIVDQHAALNLSGDGVVYHSAPLSAATEVTGMARLKVWLEVDTPDTDLEAMLYEIRRDGSSFQLGSDRLRARDFHTSSVKLGSDLPWDRVPPVAAQIPTFLGKGEIFPYEFTFDFASRQLAAGSRLRLVLHCPNSMFLEKNYDGLGVVANETGRDAQTAHVTVYHDSAHPSVLEVPVVH